MGGPGGIDRLALKEQTENFNERKNMKTFLKSAVALLGLVAVCSVAPFVDATELSPPNTVLPYVGRSDVPSASLYKVESFLKQDTVLAITNSGTGVLVTNDWGCTNNYLYQRVAPNAGSQFLSGATYITNSTISPYFWQLDGTNAIYQQVTAIPGWNDIPVWTDMNGNAPTNFAISLGINGPASTTTNAGTIYIAKSGSGRYYDGAIADMWAISYGPLTGTNTWVTNAAPPANFLNGAKSLRAYYIIGGTNAVTTTNFFSEFKAVGAGR